MSAHSDIRGELQSLRIPGHQRPGDGGSSAAGRSRRTALLVVGAVVLTAGLLVAFRHRLYGLTPGASQAAEVRLLTVVARREAGGPPVLTATGKIVSDHRVQVATKVSGQIVALFFEQGDRVEKGQLLARIEDVIYRAQRDQAAGMLARARADLEYQRVNFARVARLHERSIAPDIEFADARRALGEAEAQVAASQAALDFAQTSLDFCEVVAPIAGVILERNVEVGDFVAAEGGRGANANAQFGTIADMNTLRVEVDVSELDIARLRRDMPCLVIPDAYKDRRYDGRVMWIDPGANYAKATVQVKVRILNPDDYLRVEGSAQVAFLDEPPAPRSVADTARIWIPESACRSDPDGKSGTVFVAADGRLKATPVTIGARSAGQIEIVAGLAEGQLIIAANLDRLTDGQRLPRQRG